MQYIDPPFELGETLSGTDDDGNLINDSWLGQVFFFPAQRLLNGPRASKSRHTGKGIWAVALRNTAAIVLQPKSVVRLAYGTAGEAAFETVDGYTSVLAERRPVIVDPFIPSGSTVADDDIFWGVLRGRCLVQTPTAGADFNGDIAVGGELVAATGSTSGNSTSGRVSNVTLPAQTGATQAFSQARNMLGYALSAKTTGNTDADILIDACIEY